MSISLQNLKETVTSFGIIITTLDIARNYETQVSSINYVHLHILH